MLPPLVPAWRKLRRMNDDARDRLDLTSFQFSCVSGLDFVSPALSIPRRSLEIVPVLDGQAVCWRWDLTSSRGRIPKADMAGDSRICACTHACPFPCDALSEYDCFVLGFAP